MLTLLKLNIPIFRYARAHDHCLYTARLGLVLSFIGYHNQKHHQARKTDTRNLKESTSQLRSRADSLQIPLIYCKRAQEQAAGIEETTASLELASMVKQNVANARQASILSDKAQSASSEDLKNDCHG